MDDSIPAWNAGNYDLAFNLINNALHSGLEETDRSCAYSLLGQIHLTRGQLPMAVDNFLTCIESPRKPTDMTWQAAVRLYYIYDEMGRKEEAKALLGLANEANKPHNWRHTKELEMEVRSLARKYI